MKEVLKVGEKWYQVETGTYPEMKDTGNYNYITVYVNCWEQAMEITLKVLSYNSKILGFVVYKTVSLFSKIEAPKT